MEIKSNDLQLRDKVKLDYKSCRSFKKSYDIFVTFIFIFYLSYLYYIYYSLHILPFKFSLAEGWWKKYNESTWRIIQTLVGGDTFFIVIEPGGSN